MVTDADVDRYYRDTVPADMRKVRRCGGDYMPSVHPGFSYHKPDPSRPFNEVPRRGGRL
ncbi:MAG: hypothetical protein R2734_20090 [Nocardioides sp.]